MGTAAGSGRLRPRIPSCEEDAGLTDGTMAAAELISAPACRTGSRSWCWRRRFAVMLVFVYGFILFTLYLCFTDTKMLPSLRTGSASRTTRSSGRCPHWYTAIVNLAIFASLYIVICTVIGLMLAIFLDQKIRGEGVLRPIYLYPMALVFIVTGTAWKWFLDPGIGLEHMMHLWGWESFTLRLDQGQRHGDLHHRDRRGLADVGLRHGDVPGRACAASTTRS